MMLLKFVLLQDLEELARKHQVQGNLQPISCITMFSPVGLQASEFEHQVRGRIVQLGESLEEEDCVIIHVYLQDIIQMKRVGKI